MGTKFDFGTSNDVSQGAGEIDLPIGWYHFPLEAELFYPVFENVVGQIWDKALPPPEPAARVLFTPRPDFCIEHRSFCPDFNSENIVCVAWPVRITRAFRLNKIDMNSVNKWQKDALKVIRKKFRQFLGSLPSKKDDSVDKLAIAEKVKKILNAAPDQSLLLTHKDWIFEGLANTIWRIHQESSSFLSLLFKIYKEKGGMDNQQAFQINMGLLLHLYKPAVSAANILQSEATKWRTVRQIVNCWEGMTQTRADAWRYLKILYDACDLTGPNIVPKNFKGL